MIRGCAGKRPEELPVFIKKGMSGNKAEDFSDIPFFLMKELPFQYGTGVSLSFYHNLRLPAKPVLHNPQMSADSSSVLSAGGPLTEICYISTL